MLRAMWRELKAQGGRRSCVRPHSDKNGKDNASPQSCAEQKKEPGCGECSHYHAVRERGGEVLCGSGGVVEWWRGEVECGWSSFRVADGRAISQGSGGPSHEG